jgi:hypothetical protein
MTPHPVRRSSPDDQTRSWTRRTLRLSRRSATACDLCSVGREGQAAGTFRANRAKVEFNARRCRRATMPTQEPRRGLPTRRERPCHRAAEKRNRSVQDFGSGYDRLGSSCDRGGYHQPERNVSKASMACGTRLHTSRCPIGAPPVASWLPALIGDGKGSKVDPANLLS